MDRPNRHSMMANIIRILPVQVAEFLQARAQLPHLLPAAWLVAGISCRTLRGVDGRRRDRRPFLIVQQRVDVIHEGDVLAQLIRDRVQSGLDGGVACSGKARNDELRFLPSCLSLARHVDGLASRRTAGRR